MKKLKKIIPLLVLVLLAMVTSCNDDEENDCGFDAVRAAKVDFEDAVQAMSDAAAAGEDSQTTTLCDALDDAIAAYDAAALDVEVDCLNTQDAINFVNWSLEVATTDPCT